MTFSSNEFIRRFLLHVLPNRFQRIRYYGFLGNRYRQTKLAECRACANPITRKFCLKRRTTETSTKISLVSRYVSALIGDVAAWFWSRCCRDRAMTVR